MTSSELDLQRLKAELNERLERLKRQDRSVCTGFDDGSLIYHRIPADYRTGDGGLAQCGVRSPRQSVTIGPYGDQLDCLLLIDKDDGFKHEIYENCDVVYWGYNQLSKLRHVTQDTSRKPPVNQIWTIGLEHEPYDENYAHGNIISLRNGVETKLQGRAKTHLRDELTRLVVDNNQIFTYPSD